MPSTRTGRQSSKRRPGDAAAGKIYKKEALEFLKYSFPMLSVQSLRRVFESNDFGFVPSFRALEAINEIVGQTKDASVHERLDLICAEAPCLVGLTQCIILKSKRSNVEPFVTSEELFRDLEGNSDHSA